MVQVSGFVATERASRYLLHMCRHLQQMSRMRHHIPVRHHGAVRDVLAVEYAADRAVVRLRGGSVRLEATAEALQLVIDAEDAKTLQRLQNGLAHRIQTIGRRDQLALTWSIPPAPRIPDRLPTGSPEVAPRRPARFTAAVLTVAAVAIAAHLGLFAVGLAAGGRVWAPSGLFALVFVVAAFLGVHVLLGNVGARALRHTRHRSSRRDR